LNDLATLKARVDLRALIPSTPERKRYPRYDQDCCPFHVDRSPSLLIYPDQWRCLAYCGRGDVFDYLMRSENLGILQAKDRVRNIKPTELLPLPEVRVVKAKPIKQDLGAQIHLKLQPREVQYYQEKLGLDLRTIMHFQLGWGCLPGKLNNGSEWIDRTVPRFTIPVYDEDNVLVNVKARRDDRCRQCWSWDVEFDKHANPVQIICRRCDWTEPHPDPEWKSKYISVFGAERRIMFNAKRLWDWARWDESLRGQRTVFLTEGEFKAMVLEQLGLYAVSYGQANSFPEDWQFPFQAVDQIILVADTDRAGWASVQLIVSRLPHVRVVRLPNPPKGDVVDFLAEQPEDDRAMAFFEQVRRCLKTDPINDMEHRFLEGLNAFSP
jgi:DNA primase